MAIYDLDNVNPTSANRPQYLKAYASTEPLVNPVVDPRFDFVKRGVAPLVDSLSNLWDADPLYGAKILARLEELYKAAGIL